MKVRRKYIIWLVLTIVLLGMVCVCIPWFARKADYVRLLPRDIKAIATVDLKKLTANLGFTPEALMTNGVAIHEAERLGIDWSHPIYGFVTKRNEVGVLLPVDEKDGITDNIQVLVDKGECKVITERDGICWSVYQNNWVIGYNDMAMMVMGPGLGSDMMLKQTIQKCFEQTLEESGANTPLFDEMRNAGSPFSISANADFLSVYKPYMMARLPEHTNLSDIYLTANVFYEDNKVVVKSIVSSPNDALNEQLAALLKNGDELQGTFVDRVPNDAMIWGCVSAQGDKLLQDLRRDPLARATLLGVNMCVDADLMIKSVKGDVALTINNIDEEDNKDYVLLMQIENDDFLAEAPYWLENAGGFGLMTLSGVDDKQFHWAMDDMQGFFGVRHSSLFLSSRNIDEYELDETTTALDEWKDEIDGKSFFLWMNIVRLLSNPQVREAWQIKSVPTFLQKGLLKEAALYISEDRHLDLVLKLDEAWKTQLIQSK